MKLKSPLCAPAIAGLTIFAATVLFPSRQAVAQEPAAKAATTWQDLGFSQVPEGLSNDLIPLFVGLNQARGTWAFEGETAGGNAGVPLKGSLQVMGAPEGGMFPMWQMAWGWPADAPVQSIIYTVMAGPREGGFDLMLARVGPVKTAGADKPKALPTLFGGSWNLENRTVTWTEQGLPETSRDEAEEDDSSKPKQSFEMVVAADGKILIQNSKHGPPGQMTGGKVVARTGEAPNQPVILNGRHRFKAAAEVLDGRIHPWLPPQATEISLFSERGGHYARYQVGEDHFMNFLDGLWEADQGRSAHKRDEMGGEGEAGNPERIAKLLELAEKDLPGSFKVYYGPSKQSAAMTTYYYDRETGIAYHDRGYW